MIRLLETAEIFDNLYDAREAVLLYAKKATPENKLTATLLFDTKEHHYRLHKPLIFDATENPCLENIRLSILCEHSAATLTTNFPIPTSKIKKEDDVCTYHFPADSEGNYPRFSDLYEGINSLRLKRATSAHFLHAFDLSNANGRDNAENSEGIYIPKEIADELPDGDLYPMTITLYVEWEFFILHVLSVDRSRTKLDENGNTHVLLKIVPDELYRYLTQMQPALQPKNRECFLSNHKVFLKKGEWCYDHKKGLLHFIPNLGLKERIYVPRADKLLVFKNMDGITLKNLVFTGVTEQYVADNGFCSMQANVIRSCMKKVPAAAVFAQDTRGLTVSGCEFKELGTNGILMCGISARVNIQGNYFHDISMSALSIGDPVKASDDPKNASFDINIDGNFVSRIAYDFPSAPAINVFRVDGLSICHNTIEKTAYSAISVGWQWQSVSFALGEGINIRDAEIAYNKITDYMQILRDGAAIYVVGANCERSYSRRFNVMHHNYAENDRIREKAIGYYLDGASSNWNVFDNVTTKAARPIYIQHGVYDPKQFTWHNRVYDIYTTEEIAMTNHHPERDTLLGKIYLAPTLEALFKKYSKAKEIFEGAGFDN